MFKIIYSFAIVIASVVSNFCFSQTIADDPTFSYTTTVTDPNTGIYSAIEQEDKSQIVLLGNIFGVAKIDSLGKKVNSFYQGSFQYSGFDLQNGLLETSDSKIFAYGYFLGYQGFSSRSIVRLFSNGSVDQSFVSPITADNTSVETIAELPNGKYICSIIDQNSNTSVVVLNQNGSFDPTFTSPYPGNNLQNIAEFIVQPQDSSILIVFENFIQKMNYDGTIDSSFNSINVGPQLLYGYSDAKVLSDGTLLFLSANMVHHLFADGSYDSSYSTITIPTSVFYAKRMVQTNDGKIYIFGRRQSGATAPNALIKRYYLDGTVDNSFTLGQGFDHEPGQLEINSIVAFDDGTLSITGLFDNLNYNAASSAVALDNSGSPIWMHKNGPGVYNYTVAAIHVDANNNIFLGGNFTNYNQDSRKNITKLNSIGHTDYSFKTGTGFNANVQDMVTQADGKVIVSGQFTSYNGSTAKNLVRLNQDGSIDNSFSSGAGFSGSAIQINALGIQSDGKILVAGDFYYYNGAPVSRIIRLLSDGSLDPTFTSSSGPDDAVLDLIVKSNDEILICGKFANYSGIYRPRIALLNSNGTLNTSFTPVAAYAHLDTRAMAIQNDGKIVVGGDFYSYTDHNVRRIGRLNTNGSVDSSFVPNAVLYNFPEALGALPNGNIIVGSGAISLINSSGSPISSYNNSSVYGVNDLYVNAAGNPILVGQFSLVDGKTGISRLKLVPAIHYIQEVSSCAPFTWVNGATYSSSTNTPQYTFTDEYGVDSIVTLHLAINSSATTDTIVSCDSLTWINGITYYASTNTPTWTLINSSGCDSIVTLHLTIIPSVPTIVESTFSLPSDPNTCIGEIAVSISGNNDFELSVDNNASITSSGYSLITNLCPGIHDLNIINYCGDTTQTQFVIPVDSNYVFNNPFIDSLAQDSLGVTIENCDIYYAGIDTAYIDSIWANGNTVNVIWNIVDSNGSNFDTTSYVLNNGNGVYWLQLSVLCSVKALGDYFTVTEAIYFGDGYVSSAGIFENYLDNVALYPNPTNDLVTITFDGNEAALTIYDAQGKLIRTSNIVSGQQVSLQDVQTGVYFFGLMTEKGRVVKRVVKN